MQVRNTCVGREWSFLSSYGLRHSKATALRKPQKRGKNQMCLRNVWSYKQIRFFSHPSYLGNLHPIDAICTKMFKIMYSSFYSLSIGTNVYYSFCMYNSCLSCYIDNIIANFQKMCNCDIFCNVKKIQMHACRASLTIIVLY